MVNELIWVDYAILGIVGLSILISVWRGFMREVLSLAAWIVAFLVSFIFAEQAATYLSDYISVPSVRMIIAFGSLFLVTLFVGGVINILVAQMIQSTGLSGTDRIVGVIFGVMRGVAIVAVLMLLAGLTPLPQDPWWNQSLFMPHFEQLALWLRDFLPPFFAENIAFQ